MLLGLTKTDDKIPFKMITNGSEVAGFEITEMLGLVEGFAEGAFPILKLGHLEMHAGGGLDRLINDAKNRLAADAALRGADAVIEARYVITSRDVEKSALAYGTAVRCRPVQTSTRS